jgi:hypothetical protein
MPQHYSSPGPFATETTGGCHQVQGPDVSSWPPTNSGTGIPVKETLVLVDQQLGVRWELRDWRERARIRLSRDLLQLSGRLVLGLPGPLLPLHSLYPVQLKPTQPAWPPLVLGSKSGALKPPCFLEFSGVTAVTCSRSGVFCRFRAGLLSCQSTRVFTTVPPLFWTPAGVTARRRVRSGSERRRAG